MTKCILDLRFQTDKSKQAYLHNGFLIFRNKQFICHNKVFQIQTFYKKKFADFTLSWTTLQLRRNFCFLTIITCTNTGKVILLKVPRPQKVNLPKIKVKFRICRFVFGNWRHIQSISGKFTFRRTLWNHQLYDFLFYCWQPLLQ